MRSDLRAIATTSLMGTCIDETERRTWFLAEMLNDD
jgi:hypothetical protein